MIDVMIKWMFGIIVLNMVIAYVYTDMLSRRLDKIEEKISGVCK